MLLDLNFARFSSRCAEVSSRSEVEIREKYIEGRAKRDFERGATTEKQFFAEMADWMQWPPERIVELKYFWSDIFTEPPGAREAIEQFRAQGRVWVLSDTDPAHIEFIRKRFPWSLDVERVFTSYERNKFKRDPQAFEEIVNEAGVPASEILFLDDLQDNVDAAKAAGIDARLFTGWD